jgi:hypothetical protein
MEAELHIALYFRKFEDHTLKFKKVMIYFLDVDSDVFYKLA